MQDFAAEIPEILDHSRDPVMDPLLGVGLTVSLPKSMGTTVSLPDLERHAQHARFLLQTSCEPHDRCGWRKE